MDFISPLKTMDTKQRLQAFYQSGRFPHALLFYGEQGEGKILHAQYAAMLLLCSQTIQNNPCMTCDDCDKILRKQHPDVLYPLEMSQGKYKTETLRNIISHANTKPIQGDLRIYIFEETDSMSELCQNTLLRIIEEPLDSNRFIFTAKDLSGILTTIQSRITALPVQESTRLEIHGEQGDTESVTPAVDIAMALASKNEYRVLTAFSSVTTREKLGETLEELLVLFRNALLYSNGRTDPSISSTSRDLSRNISVKRLYLAAIKLQQYIADLVHNPNVGLFTAAISGALFSVITE